ncbi:MAG: acyltransferase [Clostridium sp.]|uniref:acyltransferase family protein n=1 Tax=Clostridium sp. TaxID=1506 RepID=UPI00290A4C01|nr:acyltransferase [Clostridium sp.]MDU5109575.1 acyltransferase [Clostridium sp.]
MLKNPDYFNEIDYMKGIAIILVFIGHAATPSFLPRPDIYEFIVQFIYMFHMPVFFFISGFLSLKLLNMNLKTQYLPFIRKKIYRLGLPFLTISIITNALIVILKEITNSPGGIKELIDMIKVIFLYPENGIMGALWFLYTLLFINILAPFILKIPIKCTLVIAIMLNIFFPNSISFLALNRVAFFLVFFLLGIIFRKLYSESKVFFEKSYFLIISILIIGITTYIYTSNFSINPYLLNLLIFISGFFGIILVYNLARKINSSNRILKIIGQHSLDIYIFSWFFQIASMILISTILKIENYSIFFVSNLIIGSLCLPFSIYVIRRFKLFRVLFLGNVEELKIKNEKLIIDENTADIT